MFVDLLFLLELMVCGWFCFGVVGVWFAGNGTCWCIRFVVLLFVATCLLCLFCFDWLVGFALCWLFCFCKLWVLNYVDYLIDLFLFAWITVWLMNVACAFCGFVACFWFVFDYVVVLFFMNGLLIVVLCLWLVCVFLFITLLVIWFL